MSAPIVGIISYETMMLLAIVVTFITMIVGSNGHGEPPLIVRPGSMTERLRSVSFAEGKPGTARQNVAQNGGRGDVRLTDSPLRRFNKGMQRAHVTAAWLLLCITVWAVPDMQEQPSYRKRKRLRLHSPPGSIPRDSRAILSRWLAPWAGGRPELYRVNCLPCHGEGERTGLVAPI